MNDDNVVDEREWQFDVRQLEAGDPVEVFVDDERRWVRGTFQITTAGQALVELSAGQARINFHRALRMGLRRVLH